MNPDGDNVGYRAFGGIDDEDIMAVVENGVKQKQPVVDIRNDIVGSFQRFDGPYGAKPMVYADWTASGRSLKQVENYISNEVLPFYGNTHTTTSVTGNQSTCFRHESRQIIAEATNAKVTGKAALDVVIFVGSGTTNAVTKLVHSLDLHLPLANPADRPVVFTSCYEHHSNLLPWRESVADVVTIAYSARTGVCLQDLAVKLQQFSARSVKIGAFSAASNVSGVLTDVDAVSIAMHKAGGIAVFDYATAAPYVKMDMNPVVLGEDSAYAYKDAIFFSGHKFVGGPGSPGVLVAKKRLMQPSTSTPVEPGGGTVFFVTDEHHRYLSNRMEREEGGTPNIVGDIRLGLLMHLKQCTGSTWIEQEERKLSVYVQSRLQSHPRVVLLGRGRGADGEVDGRSHLPVFSFLIRAGARFFHYNFVCALLNDLFGVQARGGCACAGPFGLSILGMSTPDVAAIEDALLDKHEVLRPGFSRVSFPYWLTAASVDYILSSIEFVADHGHMFIPSYRYNPKTGEWAHTTRLTKFPERKWLSNFKLTQGAYSVAAGQDKQTESHSTSSCAEEALTQTWSVNSEEELYKLINASVSSELEKAKKLFEKKKFGTSVAADNELVAFERIRWFFLSSDISSSTWDGSMDSQPPRGPLQPQRWTTNALSQDQTREMERGAYAKKRNETLPALSGGEVFNGQRVPRYVSFGTEKMVGPLVTTTKPVIAESSTAAVATVTSDLKPPPVLEMQQNPTAAASETQKPTAKFFLPSRNAGDMPATGKPDAPSKNTLLPEELGKIYVPPKKLMKSVGQAIRDWNMIEEGDRLLLGLSGGKDSLAMLHVLLNLQKKSPVKFSIACATVDPQTESFDPSPLIGYVRSLQVPYHFLSEPIVELAKSKLQGDSLCSFCARFKRGLLYSCCRTNGYNKLVLAQHLDDLAESFIMSALHNGQVRTMKANYGIEAGEVNVIRPFVYVREVEARNFSVNVQLPIINENCPACFEMPKERDRIKKLLQQEEAMVPDLFCNLKHAMLPLMDDSIYTTMKDVLKSIDDRDMTKKRYHQTGDADDEPRGGARQRKRLKKEQANAPEAKTTAEGGSESAAAVAQSAMNEDDGDEQTDNALGSTVRGGMTCTADFCAPCFELA